jgi:hypothetical protein
MKRHLLRFAPWVALMVMGVIGTPRLANTTPPPERHPHIRSAIGALAAAQEELRTGATDFCGHKAAAMRDVGAAQGQLQAALACDRN